MLFVFVVATVVTALSEFVRADTVQPSLGVPYARGTTTQLIRVGSPFATTRCMAASVVPNRRGGASLVINYETGMEWGVVDLDSVVAPVSAASVTSVNVSWLTSYRSVGMGLQVLFENQAFAVNNRVFMLTKSAGARLLVNATTAITDSAGVVVWDPATDSLLPFMFTPPAEDTYMYSLTFSNPNVTEAARYGRKVYMGSNSRGLRPCFLVEMDIDTLAWRSLGRVGTDRQSYSYCYYLAACHPWLYVAVGQDPWQVVAMHAPTGAWRVLLDIRNCSVAGTNGARFSFPGTALNGTMAWLRVSNNTYMEYYALYGGAAYYVGRTLSTSVLPASMLAAMAAAGNITQGPYVGTVGAPARAWPSSPYTANATASVPAGINGRGTFVFRNATPVSSAAALSAAAERTLLVTGMLSEPTNFQEANDGGAFGGGDSVFGNGEMYAGWWTFNRSAPGAGAGAAPGAAAAAALVALPAPPMDISQGARAVVGNLVYITGYPSSGFMVWDRSKPWVDGVNPEPLGLFRTVSETHYPYNLVWEPSRRVIFMNGRRERTGVGLGFGAYNVTSRRYYGVYDGLLNHLGPTRSGAAYVPAPVDRIVSTTILVPDAYTLTPPPPAAAGLLLVHPEAMTYDFLRLPPPYENVTATGKVFRPSPAAVAAAVARGALPSSLIGPSQIYLLLDDAPAPPVAPATHLLLYDVAARAIVFDLLLRGAPLWLAPPFSRAWRESDGMLAIVSNRTVITLFDTVRGELACSYVLQPPAGAGAIFPPGAEPALLDIGDDEAWYSENGDTFLSWAPLPPCARPSASPSQTPSGTPSPSKSASGTVSSSAFATHSASCSYTSSRGGAGGSLIGGNGSNSATGGGGVGSDATAASLNGGASSSGPDTAVLAGSIAGGVALLALIAVSAACLLHRARRRRHIASAPSSDPVRYRHSRMKGKYAGNGVGDSADSRLSLSARSSVALISNPAHVRRSKGAVAAFAGAASSSIPGQRASVSPSASATEFHHRRSLAHAAGAAIATSSAGAAGSPGAGTRGRGSSAASSLPGRRSTASGPGWPTKRGSRAPSSAGFHSSGTAADSRSRWTSSFAGGAPVVDHVRGAWAHPSIAAVPTGSSAAPAGNEAMPSARASSLLRPSLAGQTQQWEHWYQSRSQGQQPEYDALAVHHDYDGYGGYSSAADDSDFVYDSSNAGAHAAAEPEFGGADSSDARWNTAAGAAHNDTGIAYGSSAGYAGLDHHDDPYGSAAHRGSRFAAAPAASTEDSW